MYSERIHLIREKKFSRATSNERGHHSAATLTDDHTLFLLNQQREKREKHTRRSWLSRLLRR